MNRNGGVIALTVVGVLVAGGAAAALNSVVLHGSTHGSVGSAEQFLASGQSSFDPSASPTGSASLAPAPVATEDSVQVSGSPTPSARRAASTSGGAASAPRTTRHATVALASPTRASASPTEDHGGSHGGSGDSSSASPTSGSGGGSDD